MARRATTIAAVTLAVSACLLPSGAASASATQPTVISSAASHTATVEVGQQVTDRIVVRTGATSAVRTVEVQRRVAGTTSWTVESRGKTGARGVYTAVLKPPSAGKWEYRLVVPASQAGTRATGPVRTIIAKAPKARTTRFGDTGTPYAMSGDGRYVVFLDQQSDAPNAPVDVFVRDRQAGKDTNVSVAPDGSPANGGASTIGDFETVAISDDGRYVVFASEASNLVPGDTNDQTDVFLRDVQSGATTRLSVADDGTQGNARSAHPAISGDGRYVAFRSWSDNLGASDANGACDVFIYDRVSGTTKRISTGAGEAGNPSISRDGRRVAYDSEGAGVLLFDQQSQTTSPVSVAVDGSVANGGLPVISADGRHVAFIAQDANLVPGDTNGGSDVFVRDLAAATTIRVSVATGGGQSDGSGFPSRPAISADGRYVAFGSDAGGLVPEDTNGRPDVFRHDTVTGRTEALSLDLPETKLEHPWDHRADEPAMSADGRLVLFYSSTNMVPGDKGGAGVFLRQFP